MAHQRRDAALRRGESSWGDHRAYYPTDFGLIVGTYWCSLSSDQSGENEPLARWPLGQIDARTKQFQAAKDSDVNVRLL